MKKMFVSKYVMLSANLTIEMVYILKYTLYDLCILEIIVNISSEYNIIHLNQ